MDTSGSERTSRSLRQLQPQVHFSEAFAGCNFVASIGASYLLGVKTIEQAVEIQTQYAKKAYDSYVSKASKLTEIDVNLAVNAYRPVRQAIKRNAS